MSRAMMPLLISQILLMFSFLLGLTATSHALFSSGPELVKKDDEISWFKLKTKVLNGGDTNLENLYVGSYHTGAGLGDATLGDSSHAALGFLNGTVMQFNISDSTWSFFMPSPTTYDAWYPVRLNAGTYSTMFSINETGLQWDTSGTSSFGGWLACTWSHGVPQLFWKVDYVSYASPVCAQVELHPEYNETEV